MNIKSFLIAVASTAGILTLSQPASAVVYDWQFTNEDGSFGSSTDVVAGFVEFDDADVTPRAMNVAATNFQITSVTFDPASSPFFGNGFIELNENLVGGSTVNSFDFNTNEEISLFRFRVVLGDEGFNPATLEGGAVEFFELDELGGGLGLFRAERTALNYVADFDLSTLVTLETTTSVPFEFSPTLGLVLAGGFFAGSRLLKHRKNSNFIK